MVAPDTALSHRERILESCLRRGLDIGKQPTTYRHVPFVGRSAAKKLLPDDVLLIIKSFIGDKDCCAHIRLSYVCFDFFQLFRSNQTYKDHDLIINKGQHFPGNHATLLRNLYREGKVPHSVQLHNIVGRVEMWLDEYSSKTLPSSIVLNNCTLRVGEIKEMSYYFPNIAILNCEIVSGPSAVWESTHYGPEDGAKATSERQAAGGYYARFNPWYTAPAEPTQKLNHISAVGTEFKSFTFTKLLEDVKNVPSIHYNSLMMSKFHRNKEVTDAGYIEIAKAYSGKECAVIDCREVLENMTKLSIDNPSWKSPVKAVVSIHNWFRYPQAFLNTKEMYICPLNLSTLVTDKNQPQIPSVRKLTCRLMVQNCKQEIRKEHLERLMKTFPNLEQLEIIDTFCTTLKYQISREKYEAKSSLQLLIRTSSTRDPVYGTTNCDRLLLLSTLGYPIVTEVHESEQNLYPFMVHDKTSNDDRREFLASLSELSQLLLVAYSFPQHVPLGKEIEAFMNQEFADITHKGLKDFNSRKRGIVKQIGHLKITLDNIAYAKGMFLENAFNIIEDYVAWVGEDDVADRMRALCNDVKKRGFNPQVVKAIEEMGKLLIKVLQMYPFITWTLHKRFELDDTAQEEDMLSYTSEDPPTESDADLQNNNDAQHEEYDSDDDQMNCEDDWQDDDEDFEYEDGSQDYDN